MDNNTNGGILICFSDTAIAVAYKIATAMRTVKTGPLAKAIRTVTGEENTDEYTIEAFTCDELREIAEYLITYANLNDDLCVEEDT